MRQSRGMNDVFHGTDLSNFKTALKQLRRPDLQKIFNTTEKFHRQSDLQIPAVEYKAHSCWQLHLQRWHQSCLPSAYNMLSADDCSTGRRMMFPYYMTWRSVLRNEWRQTWKRRVVLLADWSGLKSVLLSLQGNETLYLNNQVP